MGPKKRPRRRVNKAARTRREREKIECPLRIYFVLLLGKNEKITIKQHDIVHRWVHRDEWLTASNLSLLHEQGRDLSDAQKDVYEAWQCAKRDVVADIKKNAPYRRSSSYYSELIVNPELEKTCPCCNLAYTVSRSRRSVFVKKCVLCAESCILVSECVLVGTYRPHSHNLNPFDEFNTEKREIVFPQPK